MKKEFLSPKTTVRKAAVRTSILAGSNVTLNFTTPGTKLQTNEPTTQNPKQGNSAESRTRSSISF